MTLQSFSDDDRRWGLPLSGSAIGEAASAIYRDGDIYGYPAVGEHGSLSVNPFRAASQAFSDPLWTIQVHPLIAPLPLSLPGDMNMMNSFGPSRGTFGVRMASLMKNATDASPRRRTFDRRRPSLRTEFAA